VSNHAHRRKPLDLDAPPIERLGFWRRLWNRFAPTQSLGPVCVAEVGNRVEAEMMTGFLRTHGLNAHVSADDAGGTDPIYQVAFGVRVLVPSGQADEARRLLAEANPE
jgi:putative signal transducing protein